MKHTLACKDDSRVFQPNFFLVTKYILIHRERKFQTFLNMYFQNLEQQVYIYILYIKALGLLCIWNINIIFEKSI